MIIFTPYRQTLIAHRINSRSFYHDEMNFFAKNSIISQMLIQETKHGHSNKTLMALHLSSEF